MQYLYFNVTFLKLDTVEGRDICGHQNEMETTNTAGYFNQQSTEM